MAATAAAIRLACQCLAWLAESIRNGGRRAWAAVVGAQVHQANTHLNACRGVAILFRLIFSLYLHLVPNDKNDGFVYHSNT